MSWRIPITDLTAEYDLAGRAIEEAVLRVLRSGQYVLGPETRRFEAEMEELVGTRFVVGVGSGTEALVLALRAVGVEAGDEVVTTPFTFFATVGAILQLGAIPVFADIEPEGFNLEPASIEAVITKRTRAIVPVHLFGRCADMEKITAIARAHSIPVIEDAAQAIGAARDGRRAGAWGAVGCFSFYPSKNLGAVGDAGCVTTDDADIAERLQLLRTHGSADSERYGLIGTNSRLDAIQAAALRAKLPYLKDWTERRVRNAAVFAEELRGCEDLVLPVAQRGEEPVWSQYTIRCRRMVPLRAALRDHGIEFRHYYKTPVYLQPGLGSSRLPPGSRPEAERACAEAVSVPVRWSCDTDQIREIAGVIRKALDF